MKANYYDVVMVGTQLGSLLCGALLAKRGFRVLLLGQDDLDPDYEIEDTTLPRTPFALPAVHSPVARRVLAELALHQIFRRHASTMDPALQVALPGHRFDLPSDDAELDKEIEREFPEVKRPIDDFHAFANQSAAEFDRLAERDLLWPPESFLERREFTRAAAHQPFDKSGNALDPLGELPERHPFRVAVDAPVCFASGLERGQLNALARMRLYASWRRGPAVLEGGYSWLRRTLTEKVETYAGEVRLRERADRIELRRGTPTGVRIAGSGEQVGCAFVIAGADVASLLRLLPDRAPFEQVFERFGEPQPRLFRYTLNLLVGSEGVPVGMARDVFFVRDERKPLHGDNLLHIEAHPADERGRRLLCVETLLPRSGIEDEEGYLESVRERTLQALGELLPFVERHVLVIDSPHDAREGQHELEQKVVTSHEPWHRGPSTMPIVYGYPVRSTLGVCALPVRTPFKRLLLCNHQVVPGLGLEGMFLAAASAARIVTKSDRKKERLRRGLWTKVEI